MRKTISVVIMLAGLSALAAEAPKPNPETVILDLNDATFRVFYGWKTPTLITPDGTLRPVLDRKRADLTDEDRKPVPVLASAPPAANWAGLDFDDSAWPKLEVNAPAWRPRLQWAALNPRGLVGDGKYLPCGPLEGSVVCLRGTFHVADPARVTELKLNVGYFGGAVVYVNGVEWRRGHLPAGPLVPDALATRYPDEAYVTANGAIRTYAGNWIYGYWGDARIHTNMLNGMTVWRRTLPGSESDGGRIPPQMLKKGVNVIGIEVRRAPVNELYFEKAVGERTWTGKNDAPWPHAMVVDARLTAAAEDGLDEGPAIRLVSVGPLETVLTSELIPPSTRVQPIRLVGARNGFFSGKVVAASAAEITNLHASVSDLAGAGGSIRSSEVQVRWADYATPEISWKGHFDRLRSDFPAHAATLRVGTRKQAMLPVWVTVHVPADTRAGDYRGTLTIEAGAPASSRFTVPIELKVNDWRIPDPREFAIHHNIYQSPDSVARYYGVPLWSDRHFELMGKSLSAFKQVGSKLCIVNLVSDSYTLGNSEGMVRWVKKPRSEVGGQRSEVGGQRSEVGGQRSEVGGQRSEVGGQRSEDAYSYDFSVAERYMDLYERICGKPGVLRLDAWQRVSDVKGASGQQTQAVTVFDPATGKVEPLPQPAYGTPENEAFWRPVLTELRQRLEKRGWFDVAAFGWVHYSKSPEPALVDVFHRIWPDGKWTHTAHTFPSEYVGTTQDVRMRVLCSEGVWGVGALYDPDSLLDRQGAYRENGLPAYPSRSRNGPKNVFLGFPRMGVSFVDMLREWSGLSVYRTVTEAAIQGNIRGLGYMGGDFWPVPSVPPRPDGRRAQVCWGGQGICMSDAVTALFGPGPDGAVFTERAELFREGVQAGEAILFLDRMRAEKKLSVEQEKTMAALLDERARYYLRACHNYRSFECSRWQERDDALFALCGEVKGDPDAFKK